MDEIHCEIHWGDSGRAERIFRANPLLGMAGLVRSVRLYTYPYEWSWEEGNPHLLVRVNFCAQAMDCGVHISRN
jgi:hypothetical protein